MKQMDVCPSVGTHVGLRGRCGLSSKRSAFLCLLFKQFLMTAGVDWLVSLLIPNVSVKLK